MSLVRFERDGELGSIILSNPPYNWMSRQALDDLARAVHQASENPIRALLIRAEGANFCGGAAVSEWPEEGRDRFRTFMRELNSAYRTIEALQIPVIAAVRGEAFGGGFELALSADLIVASETATFLCVEVRTGMVPFSGAVQRLAAAAGPFQAARIVMLSQPVNAAEAAKLNLVADVVPDGSLDETATGLAQRLSGGPTRAYAAVKSLVKAEVSAGVAAADTLLLDLAMGLYETADAREAMPKVGAAQTAGKPRPELNFRGS